MRGRLNGIAAGVRGYRRARVRFQVRGAKLIIEVPIGHRGGAKAALLEKRSLGSEPMLDSWSGVWESGEFDHWSRTGGIAG